MVNVGVIGLGMMGLTHLDVYAKMDGVRVVAIADKDQDRLHGRTRAAGNIDGQAQGGFNFDAVEKYEDALRLIRHKKIDVVDVCLPTHLHLDFSRKALRTGKHVLIEKPLARTGSDALKILRAAQSAKGLAMPAMCMRFWPGWTWLKQVVSEKTYGRVLAATFRRVASHPGGPFYENGDLCGGAVLDLHIHDTDFVQHLFGIPQAVSSVGYKKITNQIDHIVTQYHYEDVPLVTAEGSWTMSPGYAFSMRYNVVFEHATAEFDLAADPVLTLYRQGADPEPIDMPEGMGYEREIAYFIDCVRQNKPPETVTLEDAYRSVKIVEFEAKSVDSRRPVKVRVG